MFYLLIPESKAKLIATWKGHITWFGCGLSKGMQALSQRISFARIGQETEKAMAGGKVMSGKRGKETGAMQYQKVAHCTRLGRNRAVVK